MGLVGRWQVQLALIDQHVLIALERISEFRSLTVDLQAPFANPTLDLAARPMSGRRQDFLNALGQWADQPVESAGSGQSDTTRSSSAAISGCSVGKSSASGASSICSSSTSGRSS